MGISCSRPATIDDYQPTWQRARIEPRPVGSGEQTADLKGEEVKVPTSASPRTRARAESAYQGGSAGGVPRLQPFVYDGEDATPAVGPAPQPVVTPQSRGPTMLPVDEPVQWIRGDLIGAGAFGRVYAGLDEATGQLMAVKQVLLCKDNSLMGRVNEQVLSLEKEVAVLKQLDHPNIVRYLGTERTQECLNIFLEFVPGGSIASLLTKFGSLKESVCQIYTRQILKGLEYLHAHSIMHRDIKGANILVDNTGLIKLADFGASKKIEDLVTLESNGNAMSIKGTAYWMAPEIIKQSGHGRPADIWSMACTIIEMCTGKPPWGQFSSQVAALFHIANSSGPPPIPQHLSAEAQDFLLLCFTREPKERPNATRLLKHPWLADARPRTLATPLTNISLDNGPLGFCAPRLVIPSSASPSRAGAAPPISPIEEEPEHAGSPDAKPWDNQPVPAAVPSPREPSSPAVPRRGPSDAQSQQDQASTAYAGRRGPTLMGPPRSAALGANDQSTPFGQAGGHGPMGESPGSGLARRGQAWDGPGFGFGLHSPAVKPVKAVENVPPPLPLPLKAVDDGLEAYAALKAQNAAARKAGESPIAPKGNGPPVIHVQAVAGAEMTLAPPCERPSQAPTQVHDQDSQNSSMESDSYNPVEEPSWLQCESFDITRYGVMDSIATSPRPRRESSNELLSSLDRACHAALPRTPSSNTTVDEPGSPSIGLPPLVESPRLSMRCSGGAGEEELQAYVMKKTLLLYVANLVDIPPSTLTRACIRRHGAFDRTLRAFLWQEDLLAVVRFVYDCFQASVDVVRLSMPFKEKSLNVLAKSGNLMTKEALWEAELARELAEQRTLISAHRPHQ